MLDEIKELRKKLDEIERKAHFIQDYNLITALLEKLNIKEMEITEEEINNTHSVYIIQIEEDKYIIKEEVI